jgi:D-alanyl-D-alanine carboxypeptidase/D-alanyl-D-alanine-endopeptidase (penicillin-binding protein 4)
MPSTNRRSPGRSSSRAATRRSAPAANPIATLLFVAAFPAVILFGVWQYAQSQDGSEPPAPDVIAEYPPVAPATPVLSARRTPEVLARETSLTALEGALRPLGGAVLPGSCAAVEVDGVLALSDAIDTAVTPASALKLFVAAVALDVLGPSYSFTTEVRAEIVGGAVGSLYLVGGGDPLLASSWYPDDQRFVRYPQQPATSLEALADAVVQAGVTQVAGNVVGDGSRYDAELYPPTWPIAFRAVEGGPVGGLVANDGAVLGIGVRTNDPALGAAEEFVRLLRERGVVVVGQATSGGTPPELAAIAAVSSAPLSEVTRHMLTTSDNNSAEMMLKEIGVATRQAGSRVSGVAAVVDTLTRWGVSIEGFEMVDGSGLSRENKVTCRTVLQLLDRFDERTVFFQGLPVAGRSGTMVQYFVGDPLEARLVAKTGSLTGVKALAGYVPVVGGGLMSFVVLLEGPGVSDDATFRPIWEGYLSDALVTYPAGPTADRLVPLSPG